jgi:hypothetical protein
MKIENVLETVFIEDFNTTAHILKNRIVVSLWNNKYMDINECFNYINEYCPGWVQTSNDYRKSKELNHKTEIKIDPLLRYEKLYNDLTLYAKEKYKSEFNLK